MGAEKETAKAEEKKPAEKKDDGISIYKMDMHCEGCAKKIRSVVKHLEGVESAKTDCDGNKLTITGKVDPAKVKAKLEEKIKKKVEIISPVPKKDNPAPSADKKPDEKKSDDKKAEEKKPAPPKEATVVLKLATHCDGCVSKMRRVLRKYKGVSNVTVDAPKDLVTVVGTMDVNAMVTYLKDRLKREVNVVPPKKEEPKKDEKKEGGGDKKEGGDKKDGGKKDGGEKEDKKDGGGEKKKEGEAKKDDAGAVANKYEHYLTPTPTHWIDGVFGNSYNMEASYYHGESSYHNYYGPSYVQPAQPQYGMVPVYTHPMQPQPGMFSEENPNACFIM